MTLCTKMGQSETSRSSIKTQNITQCYYCIAQQDHCIAQQDQSIYLPGQTHTYCTERPSNYLPEQTPSHRNISHREEVSRRTLDRQTERSASTSDDRAISTAAATTTQRSQQLARPCPAEQKIPHACAASQPKTRKYPHDHQQSSKIHTPSKNNRSAARGQTHIFSLERFTPRHALPQHAQHGRAR